MNDTFYRILDLVLKGEVRISEHAYDEEGQPIHVVWGIPKSQTSPAVIVTSYRPDPVRWTGDFKRRRT
jgi:hypothetical protein